MNTYEPQNNDAENNRMIYTGMRNLLTLASPYNPRVGTSWVLLKLPPFSQLYPQAYHLYQVFLLLGHFADLTFLEACPYQIQGDSFYYISGVA